jgi:hypothetical protein
VRRWDGNAWQGRHGRWPAAAGIQSTAPAAGNSETEQGSRGARRKKGGGMQLRTDLQNQRKGGTSLKRTCNF